MLFKPDWDETKERFKKWWAGEYFDRCAMVIHAPKDNPPPVAEPLPKPGTPHEYWHDIKWWISSRNYTMSRTFYGGEALPIWDMGYPGITGPAVFLGCKVTLDWNTGWHDPHPDFMRLEEPDFRQLKIDPNHPEYRFAIEQIMKGREWCRGKCLISIGAFGGSGDTLATMRGTEKLLYDCVERPEWVCAADKYLMEMWREYYRTLYELIRDVDEGSVCWFGSMWSPGKMYAAHNDFSYNISPAMFRDLFLENIRRQTEFLDNTIYHLDGDQAFIHVDALCELPRLHAVQVLPGAGKSSPLAYMNVLKKIQKAGKNLWIGLPAGEVQIALDNLSAKGLIIATNVEKEEDARNLLKQAGKWSKVRQIP